MTRCLSSSSRKRRCTSRVAAWVNRLHRCVVTRVTLLDGESWITGGQPFRLRVGKGSVRFASRSDYELFPKPALHFFDKLRCSTTLFASISQAVLFCHLQIPMVDPFPDPFSLLERSVAEAPEVKETDHPCGARPGRYPGFAFGFSPSSRRPRPGRHRRRTR